MKWSDSGSQISYARRAILSTFQEGFILTHRTLDLTRDAPAVPTSCFLYLLEDEARKIGP